MPSESDLRDEAHQKLRADAQQRLDAARTRLRLVEAKPVPPEVPDWDEWIEHLRGRVVELEQDLAEVDGLATERLVSDAWDELGTAYAMESAKALVAHIQAAGGPARLSVWTRPGHGVRVYFPGEIGFLIVNQDGSISETSRGRVMFLASGLYPAWRRAVVAGRKAYAAEMGARLRAHGEACAAVAKRLRSPGRRTLAELMKQGSRARAGSGFSLAELRRYETGYCAEFAVAIHRIHGYPLAMFVEIERDGREWVEGPPVHVVARHPSGKLLDIRGLSSRAALRAWCANSPGTSVRFRDTTEKELDDMGSTGLDLQMLAEAEAIVRANPSYGSPT